MINAIKFVKFYTQLCLIANDVPLMNVLKKCIKDFSTLTAEVYTSLSS